MNGGQRRGFNQYPVEWRGENFELVAEKLRFYGSWRMTQDDGDVLVYAVDLFVALPERDLFVRSIRYESDPSVDLRSLNADLCVAVNGWLYDRTGRRRTEAIADLELRAKRPVAHATTLQRIDAMILELKTARDEALRRGQRRTARLRGSWPSDPALAVVIDLGGKKSAKPIPLGPADEEVRRIVTEAVEERATAVDAEKRREIDELAGRLRRTRSKSEARRLRAALRRLGHRGALHTA
jgi:hypothetical protein